MGWMLPRRLQSQLTLRASSKSRKSTRKKTPTSLYSKVKIMKATFCMYDIVMKRDVRVEISIPGGTHVFAVDEHLQKLPIGSGEWNYVFMSSLLRSFEPKACPGFRVI